MFEGKPQTKVLADFIFKFELNYPKAVLQSGGAYALVLLGRRWIGCRLAFTDGLDAFQGEAEIMTRFWELFTEQNLLALSAVMAFSLGCCLMWYWTR